ncbi:MAG: cyclodeaminase/cyclohydrolase family protein [Oscillospiraceae bacterium]|jgi:formiminotetrahydrofolate cyclodeaminase|nr:cyclodeaminase/cyclohydrolase family protein [Oscillospiraceae bacterium]
MSYETKTIGEFLTDLSSKAPVPGGGGASALAGALGAALGAMVANLTTGKQKYAAYQADIDRILIETEESVRKMLAFIEKDAEVFEPLAKAYGLPKEDPARAEIMENALLSASGVPMEILQETQNIAAVLEELAVKGSRLAVSDVGVAAAACRCAAEGAVMNVYINTKLMQNRQAAESLNNQAQSILGDCVARCEGVYARVLKELV